LEYKSLAVGMVHGLAGSAALLLLVLSTARSVLDGVLYILAFGAGSIAAMVLLGIMLSLPFVFTPAHLVRTHLALRALAGLASVSLGGIILYESFVL
jgi:high-affinity nickel-transport protein